MRSPAAISISVGISRLWPGTLRAHRKVHERRRRAQRAPADDPLLRGRSTLVLDLKSAAGRERLLHILRQADVLLEGYRPGVMERLRLGSPPLPGGAPVFGFWGSP